MPHAHCNASLLLSSTTNAASGAISKGTAAMALANSSLNCIYHEGHQNVVAYRFASTLDDLQSLNADSLFAVQNTSTTATIRYGTGTVALNLLYETVGMGGISITNQALGVATALTSDFNLISCDGLVVSCFLHQDNSTEEKVFSFECQLDCMVNSTIACAPVTSFDMCIQGYTPLPS
jgi:hypothetical protein